MGRIVLAYHGCDITTRDGLVRGDILPEISRNPYDWLADGMYFFEGDQVRATKLAETSHSRPENRLTKRPIATPAVVGAALDIDRWFDLTTQDGINNFTIAAANFTAARESDGATLPVNRAAFHGDTDLLHRVFDRAVSQAVHTALQLVHRNAFSEGNTELIVATARPHDRQAHPGTRGTGGNRCPPLPSLFFRFRGD